MTAPTSGLLAARQVHASFTNLCHVPVLEDLEVADKRTDLRNTNQQHLQGMPQDSTSRVFW